MHPTCCPAFSQSRDQAPVFVSGFPASVMGVSGSPGREGGWYPLSKRSAAEGELPGLGSARMEWAGPMLQPSNSPSHFSAGHQAALP